MKSNQEILDEFGEKVITECLDGILNHFKSLKEKEKLPFIYKTKKEFLNSLSDKQHEQFREILIDSVCMLLFNFFYIFEEKEQFKLIFEENNKQINLVEISEMLKAEPLGENGWIKRFSKYADEYEV